MGIENGVCTSCGSGVLEGDLNKHIRNDIPCIDNPLTAEFWWENHQRPVRTGVLDTPFRRNPNDIHDALSMTPGTRQATMDALNVAQRFVNIRQYQSANEHAMYTFVARLLDAGVLQRGPNS